MQEFFEINNLNILQTKIDVANTGHITNCYIVWDKNKNAVVIDPAFDAKRITQIIKENSLLLKAIFLTHCHADHIAALKDLLNEFNVPVYGNKLDLENINNGNINCKDTVGVTLDIIDMSNFKYVDNNKNLVISNMDFVIIHTPRPY